MRSRLRVPTLALLGFGVLLVACRRGLEVPSYPITPRLTHAFPVVHHHGPLGLGLAWQLDPTCPALPAYRVFVHFIETDSKEVRYFYDHDPPVPTDRWRPGTTVSYDLLTFLEGVDYSGPLEIVVGLYDPKQIKRRALLSGAPRGKRGDAYTIGRVEFRPPSQRYLPLYKAGWFEPETASGVGEWRWTSRRAIASFKAPDGGATLYLELSSPVKELGAAQRLSVIHGDQTLAQWERNDAAPFIAQVEIPAGLAAPGSWFDLALEANPPLQPSLQGPSGDTRELGVKVHHLFLRPH